MKRQQITAANKIIIMPALTETIVTVAVWPAQSRTSRGVGPTVGDTVGNVDGHMVGV